MTWPNDGNWKSHTITGGHIWEGGPCLCSKMVSDVGCESCTWSVGRLNVSTCYKTGNCNHTCESCKVIGKFCYFVLSALVLLLNAVQRACLKKCFRLLFWRQYVNTWNPMPAIQLWLAVPEGLYIEIESKCKKYTLKYMLIYFHIEM